jgi:hypothetical protein
VSASRCRRCPTARYWPRAAARATAELYSPAVGTWSAATGGLNACLANFDCRIGDIVGWLGRRQEDHDYGGGAEPRFDIFLGALLRGLPAQEPGIARPR